MPATTHVNPCPFCKCTPWGHGMNGRNEIAIWCQICGTRGPVVEMSEGTPTMHEIFTAYALWNDYQKNHTVKDRHASAITYDLHKMRRTKAA